MELEKMNLEQIVARLAALDTEVRAMTTVEDIDKASEDKNALLGRKVELEALESRKQIALDITAGLLKPIVLEERKGGEKMEKRTFAPDTVEYREAYMKHLMGKPLDAEERTAVSAAAVIPTQTMNAIIEKLEQTSVLYPFVSKSNIPGNLSLPVENAKNDAAWVAMGSAATDGADSLAAVTLAAYKLIKTVEIGADVQAMSIPAFETFLVNALAKKMAKAVDNAILNGTGSAQPTGLALSGQITNTGTFTMGGMTFDNLITIIADLPSSEYRRNAKFVMPSALYFGDVIPALATEGIGVDMQQALQYKILGYDVIIDDYMTADSLIFGDLSYYHFNWAQDVAIENDKSVGFRSGSVVYRAMALADGKPTLAEAFNLYTRALS